MGEVVGLIKPSLSLRLPEAILNKDASPWVLDGGKQGGRVGERHSGWRDQPLPTQGPSWGYLKVNSSETLSISGDKCPHNGSKNDLMVSRTTMGCPHQGPRVEWAAGRARAGGAQGSTGDGPEHLPDEVK